MRLWSAGHLYGLGGAVLLPVALGCSSAMTDTTVSDHRPNGPPVSSEVEVYSAQPIGWASMDALGQNGTTGGGDATPVEVGTLDELKLAVADTAPSVVKLVASVSGSVTLGSNKTLLGTPGVTFTGHIGFRGSVNVILRDMTIVGNNCLDNADCQSGADAVTIDRSSHHIWVDHCSVSDGSDGNLDVVNQSDYVTISWTKFWYSGSRPGGHQFSNLIGSSDSDTGDMGHLRVTWHHDWWADRVNERMPRARFGQVHLFNNLYTARGDSYCVGVGVSVNILTENTVFSGVRTPINSTDFASEDSVSVSWGNLYLSGTVPAANRGAAAFDPPYPYTLQPTAEVQQTIVNEAGPH